MPKPEGIFLVCWNVREAGRDTETHDRQVFLTFSSTEQPSGGNGLGNGLWARTLEVSAMGGRLMAFQLTSS